MSALLEYECQVPVGGYEVITIEPKPEDDDINSWAVYHMVLRGRTSGLAPMLQPRSERTRRFDLFEANSSAFLEFAQTPDTPDGIKDFADRYGPLFPHQSGRSIRHFSTYIRELRQSVELWERSMLKRDFSKIVRMIQKKFVHPADNLHGVQVELVLKEDPSSTSVSLCIRPHNLIDALWAQFLLAIDGNLNVRACVQCRKWFTLEAGKGRSDKEYCSNACRMRAYRRRKDSG